MKETLINYTRAMVLAKLSGAKKQTRRVMNPQINWSEQPTQNSSGNWCGYDVDDGMICRVIKCPYGKPGDLLLAREGYRITGHFGTTVVGFYLADKKKFNVKLTEKEFTKWLARKFPYRATPGRFMYKSLIRFRDVITEVRVQRVQDISQEDAKAEGCDCSWLVYHEGDLAHNIRRDTIYKRYGHDTKIRKSCEADERSEFAYLWDSIRAKRGYPWESNPWVWAITFKPEGTR